MKQINATINTKKIIARSLLVYGCIIVTFLTVIIFVPYPNQIKIQKYQYANENVYIKVSLADLILLKQGENVAVVNPAHEHHLYTVMAVNEQQHNGFNVTIKAKDLDNTVKTQLTPVSLIPADKTLFKVLFGK